MIFSRAVVFDVAKGFQRTEVVLSAGRLLAGTEELCSSLQPALTSFLAEFVSLYRSQVCIVRVVTSVVRISSGELPSARRCSCYTRSRSRARSEMQLQVSDSAYLLYLIHFLSSLTTH